MTKMAATNHSTVDDQDGGDEGVDYLLASKEIERLAGELQAAKKQKRS